MTEPKTPRFSPLLLLGDGLLLLCAAVGLAACFLSLYASAPAPMPVCARRELPALCGWAALFALLALGAWSMPRARGRALAAGGLAAVWLGALLWERDAFLLGAKLTCSAISRLFSRRLNLGYSYQFDSELPLAEQTAAATLFLLLCLALLALILGWAVVRGRCWWLVVLFTLPPLLPGLLADLFPNWPAFMALCACWCAMLLSSLCQGAAAHRRALLTLTVLPASALLLAGLTLLLPREGYTRPAWTHAAQDALVNWSSRTANYFEGWKGPFRVPTTYVGAAETVDLAGAGPLDYIGRTVLRVSSDYTGHLYLRGTSLAVYDGGSWSALPKNAYQEYLGALEGVEMDADPAPLLFPGQLAPAGRSCTVTVDNVGAAGSCVYTPYQLVEQDWAAGGMMMVEDAFVARARGQWKQTVAFTPLNEAIDPYLRTDGGGVVSSPQELAYRDYVHEHYMDVPEELQPFLEQFILDHRLPYYRSSLSDNYLPFISSLYGDHTSRPRDRWDPYMAYMPISYAGQVAEALDALCEYDPGTPAVPEGRDFVEYFLGESHRGYCMHFASSAVLLLRMMGVPARYVSGFTVDAQAGQQVDVPDRAAHAWVEIYIDGCGWYPIEVTPDYDWDAFFPGSDPSDPLEPSAPPSEAPEESEALPSGAPAPSQGPQGGPDGPAGPAAPPPPQAILAGALAGLAAALWLVQFAGKRLRARRLAGPDPNRAALYAYRCLLRLERWGGEIDEGALELAQKARFSQHVLSEDERQAMADAVDAQRLRLCRRLHPLHRLAFRYWWGRPKR